MGRTGHRRKAASTWRLSRASSLVYARRAGLILVATHTRPVAPACGHETKFGIGRNRDETLHL